MAGEAPIGRRTQWAISRVPSPSGAWGAWRDDPFGLFRHWLRARAQETPARPVDGELQVVDAGISYVVLTIPLAAPSFAIQSRRAIVPVLNAARDSARAAAPGVSVMTAGVILFGHAAAQTAQREEWRSSAGDRSSGSCSCCGW